MPMDTVALALHLANLALTAILLAVYAQNYRKMKSRYTIGLILFATLFFLQSAVGLFFDATMAMYSSQSAQSAAMFLEAIKAAGFVVLLWISWE